MWYSMYRVTAMRRAIAKRKRIFLYERFPNNKRTDRVVCRVAEFVVPTARRS